MAAPSENRESLSIQEISCALALDLLKRQVNGVGLQTLNRLLEKAGSLKALWQASSSDIRSWLERKSEENREDIASRWQAARQPLDPEDLLETYTQMVIAVIPRGHQDYPTLLAQVYDPPFVLYIRGNVKALVGKTLAFVGTRKMTDYGRRVVERMVEGMAPLGATIISGLAAGVDGCSHRAALAHQLPTVAVFGCGIDIIFPSAHQHLAQDILTTGGALVSEYPMGVPGSNSTFPERNRIIAGLSYGVVVVEGPQKSGSLITARCAMEEGRTVFAVPGSIFGPHSQGPLKLIREGAVPLVTPDDIVHELRWAVPNEQPENGKAVPSPADLTPDELTVLSAIEYEPTALECVHQRVDLSAAQVQQALTMLTLQGLVIQMPGAKACRV